MDNITLAEVAQTCCASSRSKFVGVWSADNFGLTYFLPRRRHKVTMQQKNEMKVNDAVLHVQSYSIINTSPGRVFGVHWLLLLLLYDQQQQSNSQEEGTFFFCVWDPLCQLVERYQLFYDQLLKVSIKTKIEIFRNFRFRIQSPHSNTCGLYCLYIAHYLIQKFQQLSVSFRNFDSFIFSVLQPLKNLQDLDLVLFCNDHCNTKLLYKII